MSADAPARRRLFGRGFLALFATQYCSAAGDNVVKGTIAFAVGLNGPWSDRLGAGGQGLIAFLFALPFILLSAFGGRLADRFSKRSTTIGLNLLSLVIAIGALIAFACDSLTGAVATLVLFAASSVFYGPV
jgi:acyl-[acyl-carrier-protein]-phospholipid O-acyltransferase/long-chain-fatty-acid--[acyl-carrier-protein] ligase